MAKTAARHGLDALVAPVRPTLKARYPLMPIRISGLTCSSK
jgi:hypothetical protein